MAVVAVVAAALGALFANRAVNLASPGLYTVVLGLAVGAAAIRRFQPPGLPPAASVLRAAPAPARRLLPLAVGVPVLLMLSSGRMPAGLGEQVVLLAALGVPVLGMLAWPHPGVLRASVALSAVMLARPGADPGHVPGALLGMAASAAVALVATTRMVARTAPVLGGTPAPVRPRRVAAEAAAVAAALLAASLLAHRMDQRQPQPRQARSGKVARQQRAQPTPLDGATDVDPHLAGRGRRGGNPDEPLLAVDSDRAGVLRAATYDQWDGTRWLRDDVVAGGEQQHWRFVLSEPDAYSTYGGATAEQRVRVLAPYASVVVGTPRVYAYGLPSGGVRDLDGTVRPTPALGRGGTYVAQTVPAQADADALRAAGAGPYTSVPDDGGLRDRPVLSDRAQALVARVTAGAGTDFDRVAALTAWLHDHVEVSDRADPLPAGADAVDSVLFGGRPAPPERLATVLALLTRSAGIPARLAVGFLPGQRPVLGGDFVVRARDAHSWVEIPFAGLGWQRFDPSGRIAAAEHQDSLWSRLRRAWHRFWPLVVAAALAVACFVAWRLLQRRRRRLALPWVTRYFARLSRVGARRGRPRRPAETPAEYTAALAEGVLADERLVEVGRVVTDAAFSGREPAADTRRWAEEVLDEAAKATRRRRLRVRG